MANNIVNNVLTDIVKVLRGKNGNVFLIIMAIVGILFFVKVLGPILWLLIVGGLVVLAFRYLQNKS